MQITTEKVTKITLSNIDRLDPVHVFLEDIGKGQGRIAITCYGKAWSCYWGGMGDCDISEFFCSCNEQYLTEKLAPLLGSTINDIDQLRTDAEKKGVECWRDDPWNDYEFMQKMYGNDMCDWGDSLPKITNHEYSYLCRIIKAVQDGLNNINKNLKKYAAQSMKRLFIPLNTEHYEAFESGVKTVELRLYGPRWNHKTCVVGRDAVLSKGYGKQNRMLGKVIGFLKVKFSDLTEVNQKAFKAIYKTTNAPIAFITIDGLRKV